MENEQQQQPELTEGEDRDAAFAAAANELLGADTMPAPAVEPVKEEPEQTEEESPEGEGGEPDEFEEATKKFEKPEGQESQEEEEDDDDEQELPRSWKKKDKAIWDKVPPEARSIVKRRELELLKPLNRKMNEYHETTAHLKKELGPVVEVLDEYKPLLKEIEFSNTPLSPAQVIKRALEAYNYLRSTDNFTIAKEFFKASGKRPEDLVDLPKDPVKEQVEGLHNKINEVQSALTASERQAQQAQYERVQQGLQQAYTRMASTLNIHGEAKYPTAKINGFAEQMGTLAITRAQQYPHLDETAILAMVYKELGGEIRQGNQSGVARSANNNHNKMAQTTIVGKGARRSSEAKVYESDDDAWAATAEEFGLI